MTLHGKTATKVNTHTWHGSYMHARFWHDTLIVRNYSHNVRARTIERVVACLWSLFLLTSMHVIISVYRSQWVLQLKDNREHKPYPLLQTHGVDEDFLGKNPDSCWYFHLKCKVCYRNSLLTDTLISEQLYLQTLFSIPNFTSQSNFACTHSHKQTLSCKS